MCRLALFNESYLAAMTLEDLAAYLAYLEQQQGGHGNGAAYLTPHGRVKWIKGVKLSSRRCAEYLYSAYTRGAREFLFHTRLASAGSKCDALCHPFVRGNSALAHNGHDYRYTVSHDVNLSDSAVIATMLHENMMAYPTLSTLSGTFVGWQNGKSFAYAKAGYDCEVCVLHDAWLIASSIPSTYALGPVWEAWGYAWDSRKSPLPPEPSTLATTDKWQRYYGDDDDAVWSTRWSSKGYEDYYYKPQPSKTPTVKATIHQNGSIIVDLGVIAENLDPLNASTGVDYYDRVEYLLGISQNRAFTYQRNKESYVFNADGAIASITRKGYATTYNPPLEWIGPEQNDVDTALAVTTPKQNKKGKK